MRKRGLLEYARPRHIYTLFHLASGSTEPLIT